MIICDAVSHKLNPFGLFRFQNKRNTIPVYFLDSTGSDMANNSSSTIISFGAAKQGETLSGPSLSEGATYLWESSADGITWKSIASATTASYVLGQGDVGLKIRLTATAAPGTPDTVENVNDLPTGSITLEGLGAEGQATESGKLTAKPNLQDLDNGSTPLTYAYQWQKSTDRSTWVAVAGATSADFTPSQALVDQHLRVKVTYTDALGNLEEFNSEPTAKVSNVNQAAAGDVVLSGESGTAGRLKAVADLSDVDGVGPQSFGWEASTDKGSTWVALSETTDELSLSNLAGKQVRAFVTFTDGFGTSERVNSKSPVTVNDLPEGNVTVSGGIIQGQTLHAAENLTDKNGKGVVNWGWQQSSGTNAWEDIAGANGKSFTLGSAQVGKALRAFAAYTDDAGTSERVYANPTEAVAFAKEGDVLKADNSVIAPEILQENLRYVWEKKSGPNGGWEAINGQTTAELALTPELAGLKVRWSIKEFKDNKLNVLVIGAESSPIKGSGWVNSKPLGDVTLNFKPAVGAEVEVVSTLSDTDWMGEVNYTWQISKTGAGQTQGWSDIGSGLSYTFDKKDLGQYVRVVAKYTDELGNAEEVYGATAKVAKANIAPKFTVKTLAINVNEGALGVMMANASDSGDTITYSLAGEDADFFELIDRRVQFKEAMNFEVRSDADTNNVYKFDLIATDSYGAASTQAVSVRIKDVNEVPEFLQYSRTIFVQQGARAVGNLVTDQAVDEDISLKFKLAKGKTQLLGDGAGMFVKDSLSNLKFKAKPTVVGEYSIKAIAYDYSGLSSEAQDINVKVVAKIVSDGTSGNDYLQGTKEDDALDGGLGDDMILGGAGEDSFTVSSGHDTIFDFGFGGDETFEVAEGAEATIYVTSDWVADSMSLNAGTAEMISTGASIDLSEISSGNGFALRATVGQGVLIGSDLNDEIYAGEEGNVLAGAGGADELHGAAGKDTFILDASALLEDSADMIEGFQSGIDKILLLDLLDPATGNTSVAFQSKTSGHDASSSDTRVIYDLSVGELWFDADGSGAAQEAVLIGVVSGGVALKQTDIAFQWSGTALG
jgi:Ca2+-binding RTX toxin-like protein